MTASAARQFAASILSRARYTTGCANSPESRPISGCRSMQWYQNRAPLSRAATRAAAPPSTGGMVEIMITS